MDIVNALADWVENRHSVTELHEICSAAKAIRGNGNPCSHCEGGGAEPQVDI